VLRQAAISLTERIQRKRQHPWMFDFQLTPLPSCNRVGCNRKTTTELRLRKAESFALPLYLGTINAGFSDLGPTRFGVKSEICNVYGLACVFEVQAD
jgi:hypothetical protein